MAWFFLFRPKLQRSGNWLAAGGLKPPLITARRISPAQIGMRMSAVCDATAHKNACNDGSSTISGYAVGESP